MTKVVGFGGVFFKAQDPEALRAWYTTHLGLEFDTWGSVSFRFPEASPAGRDVYAVWSPFKADTEYFSPSKGSFMFNFRVDDLDGMLDKLIAEGVEVLPDRVDEDGCGRFGWAVDLEGNKIEFWQPPLLER
ncbi:VOC family protein [Paremcibacter congregatus]|uniref:VOC family protein n=1 Tax=Paremcibacter congregatus TaxID=2043170 RepID=UPI0030EF5966|tara:strand:+ start:3196 stop:3588 length:393 start_codon:yes stop_codon:yes gene_type:complete